MRRALLAIGLVALGSCDDRGATPGDAPQQTVVPANAVVEHVVDGDTVVVTIDGRSTIVRLIGIDTPETVKPDSPVECFGPEASAFTAELLPPGTAVRIERDIEGRDVYDRLLGYVVRATDGLFVNLAVIAGGYAEVLTIEPNSAHHAEFVDAARAAEAAGLGLWAAC